MVRVAVLESVLEAVLVAVLEAVLVLRTGAKLEAEVTEKVRNAGAGWGT